MHARSANEASPWPPRLGELLDGDSVTLIEWGDIIAPALASDYLEIRIAFGATDDDAAKLRIVSLLEVDLGKLEDQFPPSEGPSSEGGGGGFFGDQPLDDRGGGGGGGGGW